MTAASSWRYSRPQLNRALDRWLIETAPGHQLQDLVDQALMDLLADPLALGREDPDNPGIFVRTLLVGSGTRVGLLYVVRDLDAREITLIAVWTEPAVG